MLNKSANLVNHSAISDAATALAPDGVFVQSVDGFTPRIAQQKMAEAVAEALAYDGTLVAESGTGTGKTYAYLVPILLSGRRTIISTATRHLQEQIFKRDLPQVSDVLGQAVNAVLLKGRANYLCRYRLKLPRQQSDLLSTDIAKSLQLLDKWAAKTASGDIAEVTALSEESPVWKLVTSTADNCLGGQCPDFKQCFVVKARQRALQADIVVVNHHLFFSDLTLKAEGFGELLPAHEAVVFDEAHSVAAIASAFLGFAVSSGQIIDLVRDVVATESDEQSGVKFTAHANRVEKSLAKLHKASENFVNQSVDIETLLSKKFDTAWQNLQQTLQGLAESLATAAVAGEGLQRCYERCLVVQERLDTWRNGERNLICWAEIGKQRLRLHGTPLRISERFVEMLEQQPRAWIFTSATLAVGDDFSAFCNQLGLHNADIRRWDSPYNFSQNALMYLPEDMPDPRESGYDEALTHTISEVLNASRGRAFCLFTSYAMMNRVHQNLSAQLAGADSQWPVLLQGQAPKSELLDRFKQAGHTVLFGTSSFWEGVDVKGENLSCVIIDKLPFAAPSEPVLKNRLSACEQEGGNPFMDIQVPEAVIALKQGVGRLIRSETDRGVLVLCDPRVVSKSYGQLFRASLPDMAVTSSIHTVRAFFAQ